MVARQANNAKIFEHNVKQLGIDLKRLDVVVVSHRHGDHTSGLTHLLEVNSDVKIYAPQEGAFFRDPVPLEFLKPSLGLPAELRPGALHERTRIRGVSGSIQGAFR
jgi:7,8-dihydropterin-6-yl-methyl-4-(beta-D-ribofuranosyl)aminobenzene 5'-phosphate synthase